MSGEAVKDLNDWANDLYTLVVAAEKAGFTLVVDEFGHLDLREDETGELTPIIMVDVEESE